MRDLNRLALGISASGPLSCALQVEGRVLTEGTRPGERSAGMLAALVTKLLSRAEIDAEQIEELRVDIGPGSYTGLRSALAFAQVAGGIAGRRVFTATSSELVAIAAIESGMVTDGDRLLSLRDGTRSFILRTELSIAERVIITDPPRALPCDELIESIHAEHIIFAEAKLRRTLGAHRENLAHSESLGGKMLAAPEYGAAQLFSSRLDPRPAQPQDIEPLYLMGSYAEG